MNFTAARQMFDLLYSLPPATCPHCHKPKHREPCYEQRKYEAAMSGFDIDEARKTEDRETARREDHDFVGASDGSVRWED